MSKPLSQRLKAMYDEVRKNASRIVGWDTNLFFEAIRAVEEFEGGVAGVRALCVDAGVAAQEPPPGQCCKSSPVARSLALVATDSGLSAYVPNADLLRLGDRVRNQDNLCTADPLYVVFAQRRIYGMDPDVVADICWYNEESEADAEQFAELEAKWQQTGEEPEGWHRTGYIDVDQFVTACFSQKAAATYIEENRHHLHQPRVYVETLYRNREMIAVREFLKQLPDPEAAPPFMAPPVIGTFQKMGTTYQLTRKDGTLLKGFHVTNAGALHTLNISEGSVDGMVELKLG